MIKKMVMGFLNGLMEKNIKDFGKMENNKVKVKVMILMKENGLKEFGMKEKEKLDVLYFLILVRKVLMLLEILNMGLIVQLFNVMIIKLFWLFFLCFFLYFFVVFLICIYVFVFFLLFL